MHNVFAVAFFVQTVMYMGWAVYADAPKTLPKVWVQAQMQAQLDAALSKVDAAQRRTNEYQKRFEAYYNATQAELAKAREGCR